MATIHQRIMRMAFVGAGMRLTPSEVRDLSRDDAILTAARNHCERDKRCDSCYLKCCSCIEKF